MELWSYGVMGSGESRGLGMLKNAQLWSYEVMKLWSYGVMELWGYGVMKFWKLVGVVKL